VPRATANQQQTMSKRIWKHTELPAEDPAAETWRGPAEFEGRPGFQAGLEREFPPGSGRLDESGRELSRRNFLKLMGASSALGGLTLSSCRRPQKYIVPYKEAPEWVVPGKPAYFASTMPRAAGAVPLVVTNFEGRPTKLEPNRDHPDGGGTDALTQASILDLYSPERSREFLHRGAPSTREAFSEVLAGIAKSPGKIGLVFGEDDGPTRDRLLGEIRGKYPEVQAYRYEALHGAGRDAAWAAAFGEGVKAVVDFGAADCILSLDCDFLGLDPQGNPLDFARRRQGAAEDYRHEIAPVRMNRLYSVETLLSLTGAMADHRLRAAPSRVFQVGVAIARELQRLTKDETLGQFLSDEVPGLSAAEGAALFDGDGEAFQAWVTGCAKDLAERRQRALVLAGSRQSEGLHRLVIAMNHALGALGAKRPMQPVRTGRENLQSLESLAKDLDEGALEALFLLGPSNPVYDTPADIPFAELLGKAPVSIHLGVRADATARACTWHIPAAHYLESWSDARSATGVLSLAQPMILPLHDGVSELELLAQLVSWRELDWKAIDNGEAPAPVLRSGEREEATETGIEVRPSPAYEEVRTTFAGIAEEGEGPWIAALRNGYLEGSGYEPADAGEGPAFDVEETARMLAAAHVATVPDGRHLEVSFVPDASVWDGRHIDNAWLQEAPDPVSKLAWDNAAYVSPKTAKDLGVYSTAPGIGSWRAAQPVIDEGLKAEAPMARITAGGRVLEVPVLVAFGHADHCLTIPLGYGQGADDGRQAAEKLDPERPVVGMVGRNTGFDANRIRTVAHPFMGPLESVRRLDGRTYPVALVQEHHAMQGRALAREISTNKVGTMTFEEQLEGVEAQGMDSHIPPNYSLYKRKASKIWEDNERKHADLISDPMHQWGMTVDLNTCIGCNACLVACQAENNIPVAGKTEVANGREMHWIRMDRYYAAPKYARKHGRLETVKEEDGTARKKPAPEWARNNPECVPQPVACVQCENAPCETVCPVNATVHNEEGLNVMAYNRCIGTRYCANNCPYKARRFNYFDYNKRNPLLEHNLYHGPFGRKQEGTGPHLQRNPNVTVRMRGVMEKCTYCVQRIEASKIARNQVLRAKALETGDSTKAAAGFDELRVPPGAVRTACQDACPTDAISFGNLLHADSLVSRAKKSARNYDLLKYIGTLPRTSYLARVKNPNPEMPDADYRGVATIHLA